MLIYCIENVVNGKCYYGQTIQNLNHRWRLHRSRLNRNVHENPHLQAAWNKYGEQAFRVRKINEAKTQEELNKLEVQYIEENVSGYNLQKGGARGAWNLRGRNLLARAHRPEGYPDIVDPNGSLYQNVENMAEFCKKHSLNRVGMLNVVNGKRLHHKGWHLATTPKELANTTFIRSQAQLNGKFSYVA